ncbi:MAG UNVERIFIED_CONTAM: hypothetical protein LVR29_17085 [Microcystis novacekii LVE1205-3]|jgi:hypothetical protein
MLMRLQPRLGACTPDLLHGAYETLKAHGSDSAEGGRTWRSWPPAQWLAAMALDRTRRRQRPRAALRTRGHHAARRQRCACRASKIFITGADHDLTDNIVHLVLCRLNGPEGPHRPAARACRWRWCPSCLPDGTAQRHGSATGLEHKMGIHGSATCQPALRGRHRLARGRAQPRPGGHVPD